MNKITFNELVEILKKDKSKKGVIVFKQNDNWNRVYSLEERSYIVNGNNKYFDDDMIGKSLFGINITGDDMIRVDWYLGEWKIDYCYILES